MADMQKLFSDDVCKKIFPPERTDAFFEALFGDASEGSYDIELKFAGFDETAKTLHFELNLHERPGCCLACNLTYGLPEVFFTSSGHQHQRPGQGNKRYSRRHL